MTVSITNHGMMIGSTSDGKITGFDQLVVIFSSQPKGVLTIKNITKNVTKTISLSNYPNYTNVWTHLDGPTDALGDIFEFSFAGKANDLRVVPWENMGSQHVKFNGNGMSEISGLVASPI